MHRRSSPTFEDLGLPRQGGHIGLDLGGTHAPGTRLVFEIGLYEGAAAVDRRFVWSLCDGAEVVEKDEASVETLRAGEQVTLAVRLPPRAPATYRLRFTVASSGGDAKSFQWPVEVPEQRVEARLVARSGRLRRGERFTVTLHNDGPTEIMTGQDFAVERFAGGDWEDVDPFDGDEDAGWLLVGYSVAPGGCLDLHVWVPRGTRPGRHRLIKCVSAGTARVRDLRVVAEFDVSDEPALAAAR